jgi:hypothetical protein
MKKIDPKALRAVTHLGIACDVIQAADFYLEDKGLKGRLVGLQKEILDICDLIEVNK